MTPSNDDYELVARRLDGEAVELTAEQRSLAEEIAADSEAVAPALDAQLPPGLLHRVAAGFRPARPARRALRWGIPLAAAAAVAVAVVLATLWLGGNGPQIVGPTQIAAEDYLRELAKNPDPGLRAEIDALETELLAAQAKVVMGEPSDTEIAVADLAQQIDAAFADDQAAEDEAAWQEFLEKL